MKYDKLVREGIPAIIAADGLTPVTHVANAVEYERRLVEKLWEEVDEFVADGSVEEMADVLEVMPAICAFRGWSREYLEQTREWQAAARGGFAARIVLDTAV